MFLQPEIKNLFNVIQCIKCEIAVHHICLGLAIPLRPSKKKEHNKGFLCERCKIIPEDHKYVNLALILNNLFRNVTFVTRTKDIFIIPIINGSMFFVLSAVQISYLMMYII